MGEPSLCPAGPAAPAQTSSLHIYATSPSHGRVFRDELGKAALGNVSLSKPSAVVALVGAAACGGPRAMLEIQCRAMLDFFLSICCRQTAVMGAATSRAASPKAQLRLNIPLQPPALSWGCAHWDGKPLIQARGETQPKAEPW